MVSEVSKDWRNLFFCQKPSGINIKVVLNKIFLAPLRKWLNTLQLQQVYLAVDQIPSQQSFVNFPQLSDGRQSHKQTANPYYYSSLNHDDGWPLYYNFVQDPCLNLVSYQKTFRFLLLTGHCKLCLRRVSRFAILCSLNLDKTEIT